MTFAQYAAPAYVHPDRYGSVKTAGPNRLLVIHTSEGSEGETSAEALIKYIGQPGDRPNSSGGVYGSSYQAIADTDQVRPAVPDHVVAYAASGANSQGIHLCIPGRAGQVREQWLDPISSAYIDRAAEWLVDKSSEHSIPLVRLTDVQVRGGAAGFCDHWTVSRAFGRSTHTDVGSQFPWDVLEARIGALLDPVPSAWQIDPDWSKRPAVGYGHIVWDGFNPDGYVRWVQRFLNATSPEGCTVDGVWGRQSNDRLVKFVGYFAQRGFPCKILGRDGLSTWTDRDTWATIAWIAAANGIT